MSDISIVVRLLHCSENCGDEYLRELTGKAANTIASLTAEIERLVKQNNVLVRKCDPFLSSADLKAVDKHCDWVAFGHAYRAMLNVRAALSGDRA